MNNNLKDLIGNSLIPIIESSVNQRINQILTLVDRDHTSPTYGCFDRSYWQYKIKDFPSAMSQESIYPLALAHSSGISNENNYNSIALHHLIVAAISLSFKYQHYNGSVDDYFPYEQASGASAFSIFGILRTINILGICTKRWDLYILRRLLWLATHQESGILSNHEALISLCLFETSKQHNYSYLKKYAHLRLERLLSWRNREGWFQEYGGLDIGYETLTFACLYDIHKECKPNKNLIQVLNKSFNLILDCQEPDGCLGGELYSRGTWNFFGHGLLNYALNYGQERIPDLINIFESRFTKHPISISDDYVIQHHLWSDILSLQLLKKIARHPNFFPAYKTYKSSTYQFRTQEQTDANTEVKIRHVLTQAGHIWVKHGLYETHISVGLGGSFRIYKKGIFLDQDTQLVLIKSKRWNQKKTYLANSAGGVRKWGWDTKNPNTLIIDGLFAPAKRQRMTILKLLILRIIMPTFGRLIPNIIRKTMQIILINSRPCEDLVYRRKIIFTKESLRVIDDCIINPRLIRSGDFSVDTTSFTTFSHVVMSRIFHPYYLLQNTLKSQAQCSKGEGIISIERTWKAEQ